MQRPAVRFRIDFAEGRSVGPGKMDLLEQIGRSGSLSAAARELGLSYRRAWLMLDDVNRMFREPATQSSVGGRRGGGVVLTPFGRRLLTAYRELAEQLEAQAARTLSTLSAHLTDRRPRAPRRPLTPGRKRTAAGAQRA